MNRECTRKDIIEFCLHYLDLCKKRDDYTPSMVAPELADKILDLFEQKGLPEKNERKEWEAYAFEHGTSGDMVFSILRDWEKEQQAHLFELAQAKQQGYQEGVKSAFTDGSYQCNCGLSFPSPEARLIHNAHKENEYYNKGCQDTMDKMKDSMNYANYQDGYADGKKQEREKIKGLIDKDICSCMQLINNVSDPYESLPYDHIDSDIAEAVISALETLKVKMENSHE